MSQQEILALLEGIEMYKDDWVKVADHVNHVVYRAEPIRSHDDCVAAFIRYVNRFLNTHMQFTYGFMSAKLFQILM